MSPYVQLSSETYEEMEEPEMRIKPISSIEDLYPDRNDHGEVRFFICVSFNILDNLFAGARAVDKIF